MPNHQPEAESANQDLLIIEESLRLPLVTDPLRLIIQADGYPDITLSCRDNGTVTVQLHGREYDIPDGCAVFHDNRTGYVFTGKVPADFRGSLVQLDENGTGKFISDRSPSIRVLGHGIMPSVILLPEEDPPHARKPAFSVHLIGTDTPVRIFAEITPSRDPLPERLPEQTSENAPSEATDATPAGPVSGSTDQDDGKGDAGNDPPQLPDTQEIYSLHPLQDVGQPRDGHAGIPDISGEDSRKKAVFDASRMLRSRIPARRGGSSAVRVTDEKTVSFLTVWNAGAEKLIRSKRTPLKTRETNGLHLEITADPDQTGEWNLVRIGLLQIMKGPLKQAICSIRIEKDHGGPNGTVTFSARDHETLLNILHTLEPLLREVYPRKKSSDQTNEPEHLR